MNLGNRYSQISFAQVPQANISRSQFDRSFTVKDTINFDGLYPVFVDEILPGDTVNLNLKHFTRLAPQVRPLMDAMYIDFFFFFVPSRLVWDNWERFNGAQDNPADSTDFLIPTIESPAATGFAVDSIYDKMGIPTGIPGLQINALPLRAFNLIWNEWFRDQNLQNSIPVNKGDGPDSPTDYTIRFRAKKHDYFTSALPFLQKGDAVTLPIAGTASVVSDGTVLSMRNNVDTTARFLATYNTATIGERLGLQSQPTANGDAIWVNPGLEVDLTSATAVTINELRLGIMTQSFLELDARGGTRYVEILKSHFNVISPDFRLQRPEFLSMATTQIMQHPVAQTSETGTTPQGNLAAYSTAAETGNRIGFSKSFVEHGYVIGLANARGEITYQQGLHKMWSRQTRYDFFWPKFQELGEQAILRKEIYALGNPVSDDAVFGYQERYAEYKYMPSQIRGQFRSTYAQSLDVWHLAEEFSVTPALNSTFIIQNTPIERVLEVPDPQYPDLLMDMWFQYKHARPMVTRAIPATLGRF